jgi:hypothetical protein
MDRNMTTSSTVPEPLLKSHQPFAVLPKSPKNGAGAMIKDNFLKSVRVTT